MSKPTWRSATARAVAGGFSLVLFAVVWFALAGRWSWWQGWALLIVFLAYVGALFLRLSRLDPDLVRERQESGDRAEPWDRVVMRLYGVALMVLLGVAALDAGRYRLSRVPAGFQLVGWLLLVLAGALIWHLMMTNAFLSRWARLQEDRGQVVVQDGAYRYVRHPMYLAIIVAYLGLPLVLGSWWALLPGAAIGGIFVYRTHREDRMLRDGLAGYPQYAQRVRYRLVPGVW